MQYWDYDGAKSEFFNGKDQTFALEAKHDNNVGTAYAD
jgi:hypothetical protein